MIADFVDRRGGGLLMLGGARSFGEGGYGGTPVADALPLLIDPQTRASEPTTFARLKVLPTRAGQAHAVTQIAGDGRRVGGALARAAAGDDDQRAAADQAGRHGAVERHRRAACARYPCCVVAALRPWQGIALPPAGLVGVADARQHPARGP